MKSVDIPMWNRSCRSALGRPTEKKEKHMKRFYFVLLVVLAFAMLPVGLLFAAGQQGSDASEEVTLEFTWWGADVSRDAKYNAIADAFEATHPSITMSRQIASWADYWPKLITQVAGGNAPDVMGMHATKVSDFVRRGALLDIGSLVDSGTIDLTTFPQSVVDVGKLDGNQYMVAQGVTMTGILFNASLLQELGIAEPTNDWTWSEYADLSRKGSAGFKALGRRGWGSADMSADRTTLAVWARQRNKELFNEDGSLGLNEKDMVDWFTYWANLRKDGGVPDAATTVEYRNLGVEQTMIVKGIIAFGSVPFNQLPNYQRYVDGEIHALLRPSGDTGPSGAFVEGSYLPISANSDYPEQAATFINFFVNDPAASKIFLLEQGAMASSEMNAVVMPLLSPIQQRMISAIEA
ncbi:MAG: extracellular solute-binding protein, partial [Spirochaetales bacterium]